MTEKILKGDIPPVRISKGIRKKNTPIRCIKSKRFYLLNPLPAYIHIRFIMKESFYVSSIGFGVKSNPEMVVLLISHFLKQ